MKTKATATMEELFVHELKDIYSAEKQLVKALPRLAKAASSQKLRAAIQEHLEQTEHQVERLDQVFESLEASSRGAKCVAMEGLIEEGKAIQDQEFEDSVLDAALIGAAQKVEHYEIAAYGTLASIARLLGHEDAVQLLQETLEEEKQADRKLTELAETEINVNAGHGDSSDDDTEMEEDEE